MLHLVMDSGVVKISSNWLIATERGGFDKFFLPEPAEVAQHSHAAGEAVSAFFKDGWLEIVNGQSHIYEATVKVSLSLATILVALWAIPWINTIVNEGYSTKTIDELFYPLLVIFMLAINNGALLSSTCILFHNITNYIDSQILAQTVNGIKIEQAIKEADLNQAYHQILVGKIEQCKEIPVNETNQDGVNSQVACTNNAVQEVRKSYEEFKLGEQQSQGNQENWFLDGLNKIGSAAVKTGEELGGSLTKSYNYIILSIVRIILAALQMAFVFSIEIATILQVYISPVFFALSLIPGQARLINAWFASWLALGLVKVSYTIIVGIASTAAVKSYDSELLWLPVLQAIFCPFLATAIAAGGGMALFNGLNSIIAGGLRFLMTKKV